MGSFKKPLHYEEQSVTDWQLNSPPMNQTLQHSFSFPVHDTSKLCRFTCPHQHRHLPLSRTIYAATHRRHHHRRLLKYHPITEDSFLPQSEQNLQLILTVEKFSNSKPVTLFSEVVDSSQLKFNQFVRAAEEAFEDLRTLVTVDGSTKRVVFSCRKSTVQFLGIAFAACLIIVVSFRVLVRLLVYGKNRFSDKNGGVIYRRDRSLGGREVVVGKTDTNMMKRRNKSRNDMFMLMLESGNEKRHQFWQRRERRSVEKLPQWWPVSALDSSSGLEVDNKEEYQIAANRLIRGWHYVLPHMFI